MQATNRAAIGSALASHGSNIAADQHQRQSEDHDSAGPDVGAEVQRVGLQSLAVVLLGDTAQAARAPEIDDHGKAHHGESPNRRLDLDPVEEEPFDRFVDDPDAGEQQQAGFKEGGEALDLAVSVLMFGISRLVGNADREIGNCGGDQIEAGMRGLGENAQTSRGCADDDLQQRNGDGGEDGVERNCLLLSLHVGYADSFRHMVDYSRSAAIRQPAGRDCRAFRRGDGSALGPQCGTIFCIHLLR